MNRKQYFVISWFFLVLMILLIFFHTRFYLLPYSVLTPSTYTIIKFALISVIIHLLFPLFILFQILGWLEPKKGGLKE